MATPVSSEEKRCPVVRNSLQSTMRALISNTSVPIGWMDLHPIPPINSVVYPAFPPLQAAAGLLDQQTLLVGTGGINATGDSGCHSGTSS